MSTLGLRSDQDIRDFTRGTDFLSANGGGVPEDTLELLGDDLERGLDLSWVELQDLADDASVVCTFFSGSIAPGSFDRSERERVMGLERKVQRPLVTAVRELEALAEKKFDTMISVEIGVINTGLAFDAAANLGLRMLDADYAGRAIPEVDCITPSFFGKLIYPMVCVDHYGDVTYVKDAQGNRMAERLSKFISAASWSLVGTAGIMLSGKEVKEIAVPGTLSQSLAIGRRIREARWEGQDPVQAVVGEFEQAWVLFLGTLAARKWEDREGYMWGEHEIEGEGAFAGQHLKLWFKNENHMSWLNGEPYAGSPDILELVDPQTAEPLTNTRLEEGQHVALIGVRRRDQFDNQKGIDTLGPRHWGFDVDFRPLEKLVG